MTICSRYAPPAGSVLTECRTQMKLYPFALLCGLLPLATIHLCYCWAVYAGHLPLCFPYIESCTSISAAGRQAPEFFLFKGLMIPSAVLLSLYWILNALWLKSLGYPTRRLPLIMVLLAVTACLGLLLYSVMLGAIGDLYRAQRRIGVILFFVFTFASQQLLFVGLKKIQGQNKTIKRHRLMLLCISALILFAAVLAVSISAYDEDYYDSLEDAFEWTVTALLCLFLLVTAFMWKSTYFHIETAVSQSFNVTTGSKQFLGKTET